MGGLTFGFLFGVVEVEEVGAVPRSLLLNGLGKEPVPLYLLLYMWFMNSCQILRWRLLSTFNVRVVAGLELKSSLRVNWWCYVWFCLCDLTHGPIGGPLLCAFALSILT